MTDNLTSKLASYLSQHQNGHISFPRHDINYYDRFVQIDKYLNEHVHPYVNQGATSAEHLRRVWLTDHGPKHIATVIRRASELACFQSDPPITPYEAYLLLVGIHFHDVGNIFGRVGHERHARDMMARMDRAILGEDTGEQRLLGKIAAAHGGFVEINGEEDCDTISPLG